MGVKEYKYLCDALKDEVLTLRGDLKKSNLPIHLITDKKILSFLPNDAIGGASGGGGESKSGDDSSSVMSTTESIGGGLPGLGGRGNINIRKRHSLVNLNEEEFVLKYCELKAKYENLLESSSEKIRELTQAKNVVTESEIKVEGSRKEDREIIEKYEKVLEEKDKVIYDLNQKIQELEKEVESNKEMLDLNMQDIENLSARVEKHSKIKKLNI